MEILLIIAIIVYIKYMDHLKDQAIDNYDMKKVNSARMTRDMDKPLRVREQNLLAGKYDWQPGDYNPYERKRY